MQFMNKIKELSQGSRSQTREQKDCGIPWKGSMLKRGTFNDVKIYRKFKEKEE